MSYKNLVIVESPAKCKTISKYLGSSFKVLASFGHLRQLKRHISSVNIKENFKLIFESNSKQRKVITNLKKYIESAEVLYLATDCDREGEAIAWHLCSILSKEISKKTVHRITFNEITKQAIEDAILHPKMIDEKLIDAYRTRLTLDFLVGFYLSPLLWKKIGKGLSAGRVQSPALRLIVERDQLIQNFQAEEFWTIEAILPIKQDQALRIKLKTYEGAPYQQDTFKNKQEAELAKDYLERQAKLLQVVALEEQYRQLLPKAPFTTSTLQQAAARELGFSVKHTMKIAQELYEGLPLHNDYNQGLITYMRTDSVFLSQQALEAISSYIKDNFGEQICHIRHYSNAAKNPQEAHEAIRPVNIYLEPKKIVANLNEAQYKLYNLIWCHTLASQMNNSVIYDLKITLANHDKKQVFIANTNHISVAGWQMVYGVSAQELAPPLKQLKIGKQLEVQEFLALQHHTKPPARFSEGTLVKTLDKFGIGRPSTYESIIQTLNVREYVLMDKKSFNPTAIGREVVSFLKEFFATYIDYNFTAKLESMLDEISKGNKSGADLLLDFWQPFYQQTQSVKNLILSQRSETQYLDQSCPICSSQLLSQKSKYGKFIGCSGYPKCRFILPLNNNSPKQETTDFICPSCKQQKILRLISKKGLIYYVCSDKAKCNSVFYLHKLKTCSTCSNILWRRKIDRNYIDFCIICGS